MCIQRVLDSWESPKPLISELEILSELFEGTSCTYRISDRQIFISGKAPASTEQQQKKLIEKSEVAKLSLSEYLIEQGLDKEIVIVDGLNEVVAELRRIGNNINQLTYLANSGMIYTVDFSEVKQEIGKVWNIINELQNKW